MRNAVALVLGGGRGSRLFPLTSIRSKPAVPLGGMYRLIDVPISNCINSGIDRIFVLTQFMSTSLHSHIRRTYNFDAFSGGYVEVLAAQETMNKGTDWYQGTADAVRKNLPQIDREEFDFVLILSGDQLYRMDYRQLISTHRRSNADVTISCMPVTREHARGFGIMQLEDSGRVRGFVEKPGTDQEIDSVRTDPAWIDSRGIQSNGRDCLASMGIYVFDRRLLVEMLSSTDYADFGKEVFPETLKSHHVQTHLFDGYWEDIGTIKSFYEANLSLASDEPHFPLFTPEAPIYTRARYLPPTKFTGATVNNSLISNGCIIGQGSLIENSVVGLRSIVGCNVTIRDSIIMGADFYETDRAKQTNEAGGRLPVGIGSGSTIVGAIIDKNCRIGGNATIINDLGIEDSRQDHSVCVLRDGIPVFIKNSEIPGGMDLKRILSEL
jgi:glucose-1-phosphate adenylyltransferase